MKINQIYVVWDKEENSFVSLGQGKAAWSRAGNAKNAVMLHCFSRWRHSDNFVERFSDQSRYEVLALDLNEALQR